MGAGAGIHTLFKAVTSGIASQKKSGAPGGGRKENLMLNVLDKAPEFNLEPAYSERELKAARDYLTRKISRAEATAQPFAEVVTINPELASLLLHRNPADENRKLSHATVEKYAADMSAGRWQGLNGQTIVISKDGYLNDGQHRLNAVILSQGNIPFTVVFGAERETRMTLDQNKVRTSGDYIGMAGIPNGKKVAAVAAITYAYEHDLLPSGMTKIDALHSGDRPTKALLHAYTLKRHDAILDCIRHCDSRTARKLSTDTRLAAALYLIVQKAGFDAPAEFMGRVIDGDSLGKTNPAYVIRERLLAEKQIGAPPVRKSLEIIFRGWNAHRRGERMTRLTLKNSLPEIEG